MGSTQREEVVPAPPPYSAVGAEEYARDSSANAAPTGGQYAPPPGAPPMPQPQPIYAPPSGPPQQQSAYAPPPFAPPPANNSQNPCPSDSLGPPPLVQAPPVYEPFSFADEYVAHVQRTNAATAHNSNGKTGLSAYAPPPRWHAPPVYYVYHDAKRARVTFHLALPSTEAPCACANAFECRCGRRRPTLWLAHKHGASRKVELHRLSPFSGNSATALTAAPKSTFSSSTLTVTDYRSQKVTEMTREGPGYGFTFIDGRTLHWTTHPGRLELINEARQPMAVLHTSVTPARLELTAFPWARMPSDELECDFPGCKLQPLYGFVFRCRDCTELGLDSFDICEPHLADECVRHDPTHRFERLPRPWGEYDDDVRETPLLRMHDVEAQRQSQELVVLTLACTIIGSKQA